METQVRERLVGALVLVALVVLFVPALLKGPSRKAPTETPGGQQVVKFPLSDASETPPDEALTPEPETTPPVPPAVVEAPPVQEPLRKPAPAAAAVPTEIEPPRVRDAEPPPSFATGQSAWAVQLGAFSTREKAEGLVAELRKRGYAAFFLEYRTNGKILHRVRVGPEQDRERAAAIAERLRKDGYLPVVAPHP